MMSAKKRKGRGGARMGAGRKPKPVSEKQSQVISVKLTRDERKDLEDAAGDSTLSAYVRRLILRHLARRRR
jgi:hypothetical protein